jgi:hypothetical protein
MHHAYSFEIRKRFLIKQSKGGGAEILGERVELRLREF